MHRNQLIDLLKKHQPFNKQETIFTEQITTFVNENPDCFERSLLIGHVTGSAWIVDKSRQFTLLTHHRKLDKWFQTGGHCDGDADVLNVALKEAQEETGLSDIQVISSDIFDIDIHEIPERKGVPAHLHYDVRFLLEADINEPLTISSESTDLAWVAISEVQKLNDSDSIMRMVLKRI
ncbi:8-oxo-dGTP pyrophosphatase MutT (NUDIX family) [Arcicella aurantiaca]|uniref:8-oxo-dGTP pyrophosphatase MutT (NUDIX family) n=1 Tax=Arcicella aurantiaca TaxID=591202 RepID=A0A316EC06_9BACT|nr:NUDIX hydrolase [Arcicella aurantiaca]PWK28367.1 8-oxo-dGTP pyrophosphatase MutT (NUDIX family) [Arcicella aurantiaca]